MDVFVFNGFRNEAFWHNEHKAEIKNCIFSLRYRQSTINVDIAWAGFNVDGRNLFPLLRHKGVVTITTKRVVASFSSLSIWFGFIFSPWRCLSFSERPFLQPATKGVRGGEKSAEKIALPIPWEKMLGTRDAIIFQHFLSHKFWENFPDIVVILWISRKFAKAEIFTF